MARGLVALLLACSAPSVAAVALPESGSSYTIEVSLDPATRTIEGRETIVWANPSSRSIDSVPIHLYLNAFANDATTWMREAREDSDPELRAIDVFDDPWGWTEPVTIRQDGVELAWSAIAPDDGNPFDRTLVEVALARPVAAGRVLVLEIDWRGRLPAPISRTGGYGDFFFVAQWFPKIAAFYPVGSVERPDGGFVRHQFHAATEFFADFADYDVRIDVPDGWTVLATGAGGPEGEGPEAVHRYRQRAVHDFAWVAAAGLRDERFEHALADGRRVEVRLAFPRGTEHLAPRWRAAIEASFDVMQRRVGVYPYDTLTVVLPPFRSRATGGMEYPTLIAGDFGDPIQGSWPVDTLRQGEETLAHEFAHQYFYGVVATNEFEDAFLDEGFTEFWGQEILRDTFGDATSGGTLLGHDVAVVARSRAELPEGDAAVPAIRSGPSFLLRELSAGDQFYTRPALALGTAERLFGRDALDRVFRAYVARWSFRHPRYEDFLAVAREIGGPALAAFLDEAFTRRHVPDYRVAAVEIEAFEPPRGHLFSADGEVSGTGETEASDPAAREGDGRIAVEILDPGYVRATRIPGRTRRARLPFALGAADPDWREGRDEVHVSVARLAGPGWDHLPVDVRLRFADGAVVLDRWDGRAPYREYRFVRRAPLTRVEIDPDRRIVLDADPENDGWQAEPDAGLARRWAVWLGAVFEHLAESATQWL